MDLIKDKDMRILKIILNIIAFIFLCLYYLTVITLYGMQDIVKLDTPTYYLGGLIIIITIYATIKMTDNIILISEQPKNYI